MKAPSSQAGILVYSFVLTLALSSLSFGQDLDNVSISGRVVDINGAAVSGAKITAVLTATQASRSVESDAEGKYRLFQLSPGSYSVAVAATGFDSATLLRSLLAGENGKVDFVLSPETVIVETVVVTNSVNGSTVDTTRMVVGGTVAVREIESLPVASRSALDLIFILPGVTEEPLSTKELAEDRNTFAATTPEEAGTFTLSGGPAYSNNITIDGLDNNDDRSPRERFEPSLEAIDEVQVITNQFAAEYGRASGGRVNLRTRGGSTQFQGRAYYFFKDEALNANTFRNNSLGLKRLPLQEHNPGIVLSGPVKKDRTFFLFSYELSNVLDHAVIDTLVTVEQNPAFPLPTPTTLIGRRFEDVDEPTLSGEVAPYISTIATPLRNHRLTARVDHHFTQAHNGTFALQAGRLTNLRQFGGGNRLAETLEAQTRNSEAISYADNLVISPNAVNQTRVQFSRLEPAFKARTGATPVSLITINDPLATSDSARRSGTLVAGSSTAGATDRSELRLQVQNVLALIKGAHTLKVGVDVQRIKSTFIDLADVSGTFSFASAGDFLAGVPSRYRQSFLTESTQRNTYLGLFFQDELRLTERLLVSFGLRYERESILDDNNNFGPRFSFAYDPFNSGKTVIRGGAGLFYNRALLRTIDDFTLGTQKLFLDTNTLRDPSTGRALTSSERRAFIAANFRFPEILSVDSDLVKRFASTNANFTRRLDPHLRIPESYQANLGFERELGAGFLFEANLTFNRGIHLWREFNANAPVLPAGFKDFSAYLQSRDFANTPLVPGAPRPLFNSASAGELVRFSLTPLQGENPNFIGRAIEFGVPVSLINLNSVSSATAVEVALAALNQLRPDPTKLEVEQLVSAGNSFYRGLSLQLQRRINSDSGGLNFTFRGAYTLSRLIDDGIVNTSDALRVADFRAERARSLLDRRHRFVVSGTIDLPRVLGAVRLAPVIRVASGAPFNISLGGVDRNLDDVGNDRPIFLGDTRLLRWRGPGESLDASLLNQFALPTIGTTGNLPRNAGSGPGLFVFDLNLTREFRIGERVRVRPVIEFDNVLNKTVFSFGSEFINFTALSPSASAEQRQALLDSFLLATRTLRHRQIRLGVRLDF